MDWHEQFLRARVWKPNRRVNRAMIRRDLARFGYYHVQQIRRLQRRGLE